MNLNTSHLRFIRENPQLTCRQMAEHIGCSISTVEVWRHCLGVPFTKKRYSEDAKQMMLKHYRRDMPTRQLAELLGTSVGMVHKLAMKYGIINDKSRNKRNT